MGSRCCLIALRLCVSQSADLIDGRGGINVGWEAGNEVLLRHASSLVQFSSYYLVVAHESVCHGVTSSTLAVVLVFLQWEKSPPSVPTMPLDWYPIWLHNRLQWWVRANWLGATRALSSLAKSCIFNVLAHCPHGRKMEWFVVEVRRWFL